MRNYGIDIFLDGKRNTLALFIMSIIFVSVGCVTMLRSSQASSSQAIITLDPAITYQTITGWEGVAQIGQHFALDTFQNWQVEVIDRLVNELGINRVRLEIRAGTENPTDYFSQYLNGDITRDEWRIHWHEAINDNSDPNTINSNGFQFSQLDYDINNVVLPMKNLIEANGETLFINLEYISGTSSSGGPATFHADNPDEYAEFILAAFQHMESKYGFVPDSVEIVNEPRSENGWGNASLVGNALVATGNRLDAAGYDPDYIAPSNSNTSTALSWFDSIITMPEVSSYLTELSYHRYGGDDDATLSAIGERTVTYNIRSGQLEKFNGGTYELLHQDLRLARVSAWQQFALAFPNDKDNGGAYYIIDDSDPSNPVVNIGERTKFLRQYFKFIRGGALRIEATSNDSNFDPLAFINTGGDFVVVIKADQGGDIKVDGLPAGNYGIKYTTSKEYDVDLPDVKLDSGQVLTANIPDKGVITIYGLVPFDTPTSTSMPDTSISTPGETLSSATALENTPSPTSTTTLMTTIDPTSTTTQTGAPAPTCVLLPAIIIYIPLVIRKKRRRCT